MHDKTTLIRDGSFLGTTRRPRLKHAMLATAAALALMGTHLSAQALALGAITVNSTLGEPLRAEIEIPQISSEEASSFQASVGTPQAFQAAGVSYNAALAGARVTLHRRANGQAYLRVSGNRPINEPFLGVVIEASWAAGKIVRDYTMLIDPPEHAPAAAVVATPPARTAPQASPPAVARQVTPAPERPAARRRAATAPTPAPAAASSSGGEQVVVQRGDTASGIVRAHAVEGASLDQMLVALLQANPKAFIRGNVNLVKAGAVIQIPTAAQAQAVSRTEARRMVRAQSQDFQAYRRGLASAAPAADASATASRSASGSVQAEVRDAQAAPEPADRLTVSQAGSAEGTESAAALSRQAQEQAERVAELNKNLSELARLQSASGTPAGEGTTPGIEVPVAGSESAAASAAAPATDSTTEAATGSDTAVSTDTAAGSDASAAATPEAAPAGDGTPGGEATSTTEASEGTEAAAAATDAAATDAAAASDADAAATAAAEAATEASDSAPAEPEAPAEAAVESEPAPAPAQAAPAPAPAPAPQPSFLDNLMENPLLPIGGAALIALLAGLGIYRSRQRKKQEDAALDSEFIESRMQPDSFFGASGGERVNTQESPSRTGASSMSYSPSQLDAAGDVDPVAEADVYLAYGRDMQAEEILKESLLIHPQRISLHRKLAEIYAKRRDTRALEAIATEAHGITDGEGPDWQAITSLGAELEPENPMYQPGGKPRPKLDAKPEHRQFGADTEPQTAAVLLSKEPDSTSLDLNLETGDTRHSLLQDVATVALAGTAAAGAAEAATDSSEAPAATPSTEPAAAAATDDLVDLDLGMDFSPPSQPAADATPAPSAPPVSDSGMIEFDMSALSADPDSRSGSDIDTEQLDDVDDDPLSTKLSLAQEFRTIGDVEGARSLAQEVVAEATGALKIKAERFLTEL